LDGAPLLANGANMAFTREAFFALRGFEGDRWASGDDMLLLKRMLRAKRPVSYLFDPCVMVTVPPEPDWCGFLAQRLRWAGKMRAYRNTPGFIAGLFAFLFPWALFVLVVHVVRNVTIGESFLYTWAFVLGTLLLWISPIIRIVATMKRAFCSDDPTGIRGALSTTTALAAFVVYAPVIAMLSLFIRPRWKGRRV
jgi:cellulose synthase/poly-beta-1,6-N-acetylglucosamine synthase-like glycosyltransferase